MNIRGGVVWASLLLLSSCDRATETAVDPGGPERASLPATPVELQFPLVPLQPGEFIHSAAAHVFCNTPVEWVDVPDGWLAERDRVDGTWHRGSWNKVTFDETRRQRGEFRTLDENGVLPRLRFAHISDDCAQWELTVEVGPAELESQDPRMAEFYLNQESPTAWYNAPTSGSR